MCDHEHGLCTHSEGSELGVQYSLYQKIDLSQVQCLNETIDNSGRSVFKPWEDRFSRDKFVVSDTDEELLFNIPFTGNVKLKGIIVLGEDDSSHPAELKLFKNRPHMSFDDARMAADQEFQLSRDPHGLLEYNPKIVTFSSVHHLTMYFTANFGDENTKIYYIGLKGEFSECQRTGVVNAVYESRAMVQDHKQTLHDQAFSQGPQF